MAVTRAKVTTTFNNSKKLPEYTREEVKRHNSRDDIWVVISNEVYDLTSWIGKHPGGSRIIEVQGGYDVTSPFFVNHTENIRKRANPFKIGVLKYEEHEGMSPLGEDLLALREEMREEGFFKTDLRYIKCRVLFNAFLFISAWYLVAKCRSLTAQVLGAFTMAIYLQQMDFIGHDLRHGSISNDLWLDYLIGSVMCVLEGLSMSWWKMNHQTHHVVTNSIEHDPDIQFLPFLAVNIEQLEHAYFSKYYRKWFEFNKITKTLVGLQHYTSPIVLWFSRINLHINGLTALLSEPHIPTLNRYLELGGFCLYLCWQYVFYKSAGSSGRSLLVFFITYAFCGTLISLQIGISHWISPVIHHHPDRRNWFRHQFATTVDIDCWRINDWFHGGLQFQVAHHIFPTMPRCHLLATRKRIKVIAKKHGVEYKEMAFWGMIIEMWAHFGRIAAKAVTLPTSYAPQKVKQL